MTDDEGEKQLHKSQQFLPRGFRGTLYFVFFFLFSLFSTCSFDTQVGLFILEMKLAFLFESFPSYLLRGYSLYLNFEMLGFLPQARMRSVTRVT